MFCMVCIARDCRSREAGKNMPRETRDRLIMRCGETLYLSYLFSRMVTHFLVPDKLKFSIFKLELIHYS